MKRTLALLTGLAVVLAVQASADPTATAKPAGGEIKQSSMTHMPMTIEQRVNHLNEKLNLTADQKTKVTEIFNKSQVQALTEKIHNNKGDRAARQTAMTQLSTEMDSVNKQIEGVLTDSQKTTFQKMVADDKAAAKKMKPEPVAATKSTSGTH